MKTATYIYNNLADLMHKRIAFFAYDRKLHRIIEMKRFFLKM